MNGAESLIRSFVDAGVTCCFANPGTSEMHLVQAIDAVPQMRAVLALFEGVLQRRGGWLRADARRAGVDVAAPRCRSRQRGCRKSAQCAPRKHAPHQRSWGSRDPSRCVRCTAHVGHRRRGETGVGVDPHRHVGDDSGRERAGWVRAAMAAVRIRSATWRR
jgi:hypothetical protein